MFVGLRRVGWVATRTSWRQYYFRDLWRTGFFVGVRRRIRERIRIRDVYTETFNNALETAQSVEQFGISWVADFARFTWGSSWSGKDTLDMSASAIGTRV
jgi:hypothetical protein